VDSFIESECGCGKVWRGKPGTNPATGCEVCYPVNEPCPCTNCDCSEDFGPCDACTCKHPLD
jgi:hypothetical protein